MKKIFAAGTMLALTLDINNSGIIGQLLVFFVVILCIGIVWALGHYGFPKLKLPGIVVTVWDCIFVLIGAIMLINFLLSLVGRQFIRY
jgi:hypothetical protein